MHSSHFGGRLIEQTTNACAVYRIHRRIGRSFFPWKRVEKLGVRPIRNHNKNLGTSYHEYHIRVTRFSMYGTTIAIVVSQQFHGSYPVLTIWETLPITFARVKISVRERISRAASSTDALHWVTDLYDCEYGSHYVISCATALVLCASTYVWWPNAFSHRVDSLHCSDRWHLPEAQQVLQQLVFMSPWQPATCVLQPSSGSKRKGDRYSWTVGSDVHLCLFPISTFLSVLLNAYAEKCKLLCPLLVSSTSVPKLFSLLTHHTVLPEQADLLKQLQSGFLHPAPEKL